MWALRFIESSALVAALLEQDAEAQAAVREIGRRISVDEERSALRGLRRFERHCVVVDVTEAVLTRAGRQFSVEPIRTLDAIHLATLELIGDASQLVTVVTRDARFARNAKALGYAVA